MTSTISNERRQEWITAYKGAIKNLSRVQSILAFLAKVTTSDCVRNLELDDCEYDGMHILLEYLAKQTLDTVCNDLPYPDLFAELCGGKEGREND